MKVKTEELKGEALDWAVAQCEGRTDRYWKNHSITGTYSPSTYWMLGGPIIEFNKIYLNPILNYWEATCENEIRGAICEGDTALIAAMRSYVASKLGDEVDVLDELVGKDAS